MDSLCFDEQVYKKLLPVPKTHLFMKKMAKIQAIDRQIRRKWIKIKRDNQKHHLIISENETSLVLNPSPQKSSIQINFSPTKDHSQISNVRNNLKRQKILNNHKKQEQIFYARKEKSRYKSHSQNDDNLKQTQSHKEPSDFLSVSFDSPGRRIKTQSLVKKTKQQNRNPSILQSQKNTKNSPQRQRQSQKNLVMNNKKLQSGIKLPRMVLKTNQHKNRQIKILSCQSEKQLIELSHKSQQNMKQWASQRKNLYQKLKGSKAYYIMRTPTKLQMDQGQYIV